MPTDPEVLKELAEDERTVVEAFARLSQPSRRTVAPKPLKTLAP